MLLTGCSPESEQSGSKFYRHAYDFAGRHRDEREKQVKNKRIRGQVLNLRDKSVTIETGIFTDRPQKGMDDREDNR